MLPLSAFWTNARPLSSERTDWSWRIVVRVTTPACRAAVAVSSLKTEPGSYTADTTGSTKRDGSLAAIAA